MDKRKKVERAQKGLLELLAQMGGGEVVEKLKEQPLVNEHDLRTELEAEGILLTLQSDKRTVVVKPCKECGEPFGTNYKYVAYCTNACRALALKKLGVKWDPTKKDQQRWGTIDNPSQLPIIISKAALDVITQLRNRTEIPEPRTQTRSLLPPLGPAIAEVYREGNLASQEHSESVLKHLEYRRLAELHKSEELVTTNPDPEPLVSTPSESLVKFDLDLFQ